MSYDIQIWSVDPVSLPDALPDMENWQREGPVWVYGTKNWQIVINSSAKVILEDVPGDVVGKLPGISYLTELNLEPISAPKSARKHLIAVSKLLGKATHGVILDPQADQVITPSGIKRYRPRRRQERFSILTFTWWFNEGPLQTAAGLNEFVSFLERALPEAIPRRFGLVEPPQHLYSETGREYFIEFLKEHLDDTIVWYPHRPVVGVFLHMSSNRGITGQSFRANYVKVEVEAQALNEPGWEVALEDFWRGASQLIKPFYGDVRTLDGFIRMGATHGSDSNTDFHPVRGPWWTGIPRVVGHAVVLGKPYLNLWPRFIEVANLVGGLKFLSTKDWKTQEEVSDLVDGVPEPLAQRWIPKWTPSPYGGKAINWNTEYPAVWPFEDLGVD